MGKEIDHKSNVEELEKVAVCVRTSQYLFFFGLALGVVKFPGQGLNLHHRSDLSHCSVNARSLTS